MTRCLKESDTSSKSSKHLFAGLAYMVRTFSVPEKLALPDTRATAPNLCFKATCSAGRSGVLSLAACPGACTAPSTP